VGIGDCQSLRRTGFRSHDLGRFFNDASIKIGQLGTYGHT
jgi:hypothetical protein